MGSGQGGREGDAVVGELASRGGDGPLNESPHSRTYTSTLGRSRKREYCKSSIVNVKKGRRKKDSTA